MLGTSEMSLATPADRTYVGVFRARRGLADMLRGLYLPLRPSFRFNRLCDSMVQCDLRYLYIVSKCCDWDKVELYIVSALTSST